MDLGFGMRSLRRRLKEAGLSNQRIDAVLVTHGHSDHTSGVGALARRCRIPVFMNEGTRSETESLREIDRWERFDPGRSFSIGDLDVEPFSTSHDSAQPVGFRFRAEGVQGVLATDLGEIDPGARACFEGSDWLILESNHDEHLLKIGPYPWPLKQRVLGRRGHLSNSAVARFLEQDFDGRARAIFLAHLSRQNNDPEIALDSARRALLRRRNSLFESCRLHLTHQSKPSIVLEL